MSDSTKINLPPSATHPIVVTIGFIVLVLSFTFFKISGVFTHNLVYAAIFCMASVSITHFILDFFFLKVHRRPTTGLNFDQRTPSLLRALIKLFGLVGSIGFVALCYWLFPEYHGDFYAPYWELISIILPLWLIAAPFYFYKIDMHMIKPEDGYWNMGQLLLLQLNKVNSKALWQHLLGWVVKGFFLPLMFVYFCNDLSKLQTFDLMSLHSFQNFFDFFYSSIFLIDVGIVSIGYLMSFRLFDSHLRSSEPTMLGWVVALACYEPFWSLVGKQYLDYNHGSSWGAWLSPYPMLYTIWGSIILILFSIYVWASLMFGIRFSNLTHRGIITNGPYRYTKHPAYWAKNIAWWFITVPFLAGGGDLLLILKSSLLLLLLNGIYYLRARTEEAHLSQDPVYVQYALWMNTHGLFAKLGQLPGLKFIQYRPPS